MGTVGDLLQRGMVSGALFFVLAAVAGWRWHEKGRADGDSGLD
jgi:hypothetical protein